MVKPASAVCNLACDYCFYLDTARHRENGVLPLMSDEVAKTVIEKSLQETRRCHFIFQGGEPSLANIDFFERFIAYVAAFKKPDQIVTYAFQTNGLRLDEQWAHFFKAHDVLVGISFDGSARLHDLHRKDALGRGSGRSVASSIALMRQEEVPFNVLTVVTEDLAQNIRQAFSYLVNHGVYYHQYIVCLDPIEGGKSWISPKTYGTFLKELFDLWFSTWQTDSPVSIRFFDNLVGMLLAYPPESCDMNGVCSIHYVIESDGSVYPCDFYCNDAHCLGSILDKQLAELDEQRKRLRFIEDSPNRIDACSDCPWRTLCRGGCKRTRTDAGYKYCSSMQDFFPYAISRLELMAKSQQES